MEISASIHSTRSFDHISRSSKGEMMLLKNLHLNGGSMQAKELAQIAGISTARVSAILNVEEEKGFIRRDAIAGDRRKVNVILTKSGELEVQKQNKEIENHLTEYFEFLGETETKNFVEIMEHTKQFMEAKRKENQGK